MRILFLFLFLITVKSTWSQSPIYTWRTFNFGISPGLTTNGMHPQKFGNNISINLVSGYSAALKGFEISGISSFNSFSSTGIQISGLVNTTGGNRKFLKDYSESELLNLASNFQGAQFSGIVNIVTGGFLGLQVSGVSNLVLQGNMSGLQLSSSINFTAGYVEGAQMLV